MSEDTKLNQQTYILSELSLLFADLEDLSDLNQADILVRSKDYFATLANKLENLTPKLKKSQSNLKIDLENIIEELLFLQANYQIKKK